MFATSLGLLLWFVVLHILLPWIAGILFVWLVFGRNRTGIILHCLARLVGVGVIANWLFDLQFLRFGVGAGEYMLLVGVLVVALGIKIFLKKDSLKNYLATLRIERSWTAIKDAYVASSRTEQVLTWLAGGLSLVFLATSFVFTTHLPTYADDSFGNRHRPVINILHDGGVHMFGNEDVILARGRLGYPIHIPLYNALVADMAGGYNDIYINLFQRVCLVVVSCFLVAVTWAATGRLLWTLLPVGLICSLPLVFIHSVEGYHDLPVTLYAIVAVRCFLQYIQTRAGASLAMGILLGCVLSYIKLEGLIIYFPALVLMLIAVAWWEGSLRDRCKALFGDAATLTQTISFFVFGLLPFQVVRIMHGWGFNPSSLESGEVLDQTIHREIFKYFKPIFLQEDNYGAALLLVLWSLYLLVRAIKKKDLSAVFLLGIPVVLFILFTLVFLLTNNYQRVLNQTTVNRVYTMCFVVLFAFIGFTRPSYVKE